MENNYKLESEISFDIRDLIELTLIAYRRAESDVSMNLDSCRSAMNNDTDRAFYAEQLAKAANDLAVAAKQYQKLRLALKFDTVRIFDSKE